jgi:hypothetical protein
MRQQYPRKANCSSNFNLYFQAKQITARLAYNSQHNTLLGRSIEQAELAHTIGTHARVRLPPSNLLGIFGIR